MRERDEALARMRAGRNRGARRRSRAHGGGSRESVPGDQGEGGAWAQGGRLCSASGRAAFVARRNGIRPRRAHTAAEIGHRRSTSVVGDTMSLSENRPPVDRGDESFEQAGDEEEQRRGGDAGGSRADRSRRARAGLVARASISRRRDEKTAPPATQMAKSSSTPCGATNATSRRAIPSIRRARTRSAATRRSRAKSATSSPAVIRRRGRRAKVACTCWLIRLAITGRGSSGSGM